MKILETTSVRSQSLPTVHNSGETATSVSFEVDKLSEINKNHSNKPEATFTAESETLCSLDQLKTETIESLSDEQNIIKMHSNDKSTTKLLFSKFSDENISRPMAERGRLMACQQVGNRLVERSGESNITLVNVTKRNRKFLVDFMTTITELKWRYHILFYFVSFVLSWVLFGLAWYIVAWVNDDLDPLKTDLCVLNVRDFSSAFLFSIETQTTIGYGYRYINSDCAFGTFLIMLQSCFGIFITCLTTGIIFGKISRPKRRSQTIMFSNNAVICKRDGEYSFQFRVGDMRKTHIIGTSIRAIFVNQRKTIEDGIIPLCQYPLEIETETSKLDSFIFFLWPVTISHKINESSPFWKMSAEDILLSHFEVVVILEGTVPTNGSLIQVRTSYISSEIRWGQMLTPLITVETFEGECVIDYSKFHDTTPITMHECSAAENYAKKQMRANEEEIEENNFPASFSAPPVRLHEMSPKFLKALANGLLWKQQTDHKKSKSKTKSSHKGHNNKLRTKIIIGKRLSTDIDADRVENNTVDVNNNNIESMEITHL